MGGNGKGLPCAGLDHSLVIGPAPPRRGDAETGATAAGNQAARLAMEGTPAVRRVRTAASGRRLALSKPGNGLVIIG